MGGASINETSSLGQGEYWRPCNASGVLENNAHIGHYFGHFLIFKPDGPIEPQRVGHEIDPLISECLKWNASKATTMKLKHSLLTLLVAVMFPASPVNGTVDSTVTALNLTVRVQGDFTVNGDVETGRVIVVRVGAKQIIELLEDLFDTNYPAGAKLFVTVDGDVWIVDNRGNFLDDVSDFVSADLDFSIEIFKGTFNFETEQENSVINFLIRFFIDIPADIKTVTAGGGGDGGGVFLELFGVAKENFTGGKPKPDGTQVFRGTINAGLAGSGTVDDRDAVAEGNVILNGKEVED